VFLEKHSQGTLGVKGSKEKAMVPPCDKVDLCQIPTRILIDLRGHVQNLLELCLNYEGAWRFVDEDS
jgi:hypothetical protein